MRRCFFVFDYDNDVSRAEHISDLGLVHATAAAGFDDLSLWEKAKKEGNDAISRLIEEALTITSATVVLIGEATAELDYVNSAIEKSIGQNNGILGIFVNDLKDHEGQVSPRGKVPYQQQAAQMLEAGGYTTHDWDEKMFGEWVNIAATEWKKFARKKPLG